MTTGEFLLAALADPEQRAWVCDGENVESVARQSDKRPAYMRWFVPDEIVKSMVGDAERRGVPFLVWVPRELAEGILRTVDGEAYNTGENNAEPLPDHRETVGVGTTQEGES